MHPSAGMNYERFSTSWGKTAIYLRRGVDGHCFSAALALKGLGIPFWTSAARASVARCIRNTSTPES